MMSKVEARYWDALDAFRGAVERTERARAAYRAAPRDGSAEAEEAFLAAMREQKDAEKASDEAEAALLAAGVSLDHETR